MSTDPPTKSKLESLGSILLDIAQERSAEALLKKTTQRLAKERGIIRVRLWLTLPGDICPTCSNRQSCKNQTYCLHLMADAGNSSDTPEEQLTADELLRRLPLNHDDIGAIVSTGETLENQPSADGTFLFCGLPLRYKWVVLGVLAIDSNEPILQDKMPWLRLIANHAGIAIANTRAFEEIERLKKQLELENAYLREELQEAQEYGDIIGQSPSLQNVIKKIDLVAPTNASVLILGDSGTGKELIAREIHRRSLRRDRPMIKVNCASIPRELYESEFFGHAKGAFTGAVNDRAGRFEAANGGTLFLDEVGEIPLELQSKLLRVLQEGQYERVGEEVTRQVDVRIIASTNKNLQSEAKAKHFRQDLYYRLNVFPITIEPLENRKEDIPILADHFVTSIAARMDRPKPRLTQGNILSLQAYSWPGNVRELQNIIERAVITSKQGVIRLDLPASDSIKNVNPKQEVWVDKKGEKICTELEMRQQEKANILAALQKCNWKIYGSDGAAQLLEIKPTTLTARIKKMGIKKPAR